MRSIVLVVHNVRSVYNVGSMLRTADGLGIDEVYLTGYTPYPAAEGDKRLPHLAAKISHRIQKTSLGAEKNVRWKYVAEILDLLSILKTEGYEIVALEQTEKASDLAKFKPSQDIALIVGSEVSGLDKAVLDLCDAHLQIPMAGQKESFNVSVAAAIALYYLRNM